MGNYGCWNGYHIPDDRSGWHPAVSHIYEYWLAAAPPGGLPGRQHISPLEITAYLPRILLIDVHRNPLRFCYRLVGTDVIWSRRSDPTGQWLHEVHPENNLKPFVDARYRYMADTGSETWRRGGSIWDREPRHLIVENCLMPLAKDARTVDMIFGISVVFDSAGKEMRP